MVMHLEDLRASNLKIFVQLKKIPTPFPINTPGLQQQMLGDKILSYPEKKTKKIQKLNIVATFPKLLCTFQRAAISGDGPLS